MSGSSCSGGLRPAPGRGCSHTPDQAGASRYGKCRDSPAIGGKGNRMQATERASWIALLPDGAIVVADTGNHRVQIFPPPYALLQVLGSNRTYSAPPSREAAKRVHRPWGVAVEAAAWCTSSTRAITGGQIIARQRDMATRHRATSCESHVYCPGPEGLVAVAYPDQQTVFLFRSGNPPPSGCPSHRGRGTGRTENLILR